MWIDGLDGIQAVRGVLACIDMSATPFFITGSGYPEGTPFPWLVSDFGLVDAIESGIVKVPRVPVATDSGRPEPEYFRLWEHINGNLPPSERGNSRRKPRPEAVVREADAALQQLAGEWKDTFEQFKREHYPVPPCLIVVADNTDISELLFERIARDGQVFPEYLRNEDGRDVTMRIDSKLLARAEEGDQTGSREDRAEALRRRVATVGKAGESGAEVRCVVSVGMLTEGWDAQNVTHILGLRAFQSQLLCEQVVGRGLRRMNYDFDELDEEGVPVHVEYVDVYGIPFEVIPVKKVPTNRQPPPQRRRCSWRHCPSGASRASSFHASKGSPTRYATRWAPMWIPSSGSASSLRWSRPRLSCEPKLVMSWGSLGYGGRARRRRRRAVSSTSQFVCTRSSLSWRAAWWRSSSGSTVSSTSLAARYSHRSSTLCGGT